MEAKAAAAEVHVAKIVGVADQWAMGMGMEKVMVPVTRRREGRIGELSLPQHP
jgi:hypothetical protein